MEQVQLNTQQPNITEVGMKRDLLTPLDFTVDELDQLFNLADDIQKNSARYAHACAGKKMATCFYEPSTRTRLSHETAMLNLGGSVMGFPSGDVSSATKGETLRFHSRH